MNKPSLTTGQTLTRLAAIAVVPLIVIALFLWAGGWLTPDKLSSDKLITVLQNQAGSIPATDAIMPKVSA